MQDSLIILQQKTKPRQQDRPQPDVLTEVMEDMEDEETPWRVLLFDDDIHTFDEVINQLVKALNCEASYAEELTFKVHNEGKAKVYEGTFEACFEVNSVLEEIQLVTEIKG
jgi:ATP-dependent Clp protease adapter protein ClpS